MLGTALALVLAIAPNAIRAHIHFLASDAVEGREAGTRGYDVAAAYVAAQFEAAGAEPAGDDGTYFQQLRMRTSLLDARKSAFAIGGTPFEHRKDVLIWTGNESTSDVDAPVVFAGFGVTAPELGYDDYRGLDVRGRIVALLAGAPPRFPHSQRAYYSSGTAKSANAAGRGAVGMVVIRTLDSERRFAWARTIANGDSVAMSALDRNGQPMENFPQIRGGAVLGPAAAQALFAGEAATLDAVLAGAEKSIAHPFALKKRVAIHTTTTIGHTTSANVVAVVRGSELPNEYVVVSAHLDHLGINDRGEDRIRNGALDNASGIAALLEIARDVAAMSPRPRRSIVFAAVTAEEKGAHGSLAFAERPTVQGTIVANVNMDMLTMLFPMKSLVALGMEHSSLAPLARAAAERNGFALQDDPQPEEVRFIRSDQFSFVKKGIPAITYKGGFQSADPAIDGETLTRDWLRTVYHSPADESGQKIDYESGAGWARVNRDLAVAIANGKERPRWNEGDFFGMRFAPAAR
ncbi:MAG TPA: M28 family metallopeptidase [Thermoanaerobaculia bacterium]|nr:M28 family metallopeptidase [Thermoanaerobaculia bacterium]